MGILDGFLRTIRYRKTAEGYKWQSEDTHESSVKFDDGTTLTDKMTEIQEKMTETTESLNSHQQSASTITEGTFAGDVSVPATTAYGTALMRNAVTVSTKPTAGASASYPNGTIVFVKKG